MKYRFPNDFMPEKGRIYYFDLAGVSASRKKLGVYFLVFSEIKIDKGSLNEEYVNAVYFGQRASMEFAGCRRFYSNSWDKAWVQIIK